MCARGLFCGSGAALARGCVRPVPVVRFYRNVVCLFAPVIRFSRNVLRSITPAVCRIAPNRTACDILRFYSAGSRSPFVRSRSALRLSALAGSLRACAFICGDLDGLPENGERGWRRGFCALLRGRIGLDMLSAGSPLGLRAPNLRQRVFDSLDSLHAAAGLGWCVYAPPSPGHNRRPA